MADYREISPLWLYKIVEQNKKNILGYDESIRFFHSKERAEEYIAFCNMVGCWHYKKAGRGFVI